MSKKLLSLFVALALCIAILPAMSVSADTYTPIYTAADLAAINNNLSGNYILMNDIDLSKYNDGVWSPIGTTDSPFTGVLNGNGKSVYNMAAGDGVFKNVVGASFYNLTIDNSFFQSKSAKSFTYGGISNNSENSLFVECLCTGSVDVDCSGFGVWTSANIGGLVGVANNSTFRNCINRTSLGLSITSGQVAVGGIVGNATQVKILDSYNDGIVFSFCGLSGGAYSGGVAGISNQSEIYKCHNKGKVTASVQTQNLSILTATAGGICGSIINTHICFAYNISEVSTPDTRGGNGAICGGIAGDGVKSTISNCYNNGKTNIYGNGYYCQIVGGGIIGLADNMILNNVYNIGDMYAENNSYHGHGGSYCGGMIGRALSSTSVTNGYVAQSVYDTTNMDLCADIIGSADQDVTISNIYYLSSKDMAIGTGTPMMTNVKAVTTSEMKVKETFEGFDFERVWILNFGEYPSLRFNKYANSTNNNAVINGKGYAYLRYKLADENDNILINTPIEYFIDGYDSQGIAMTDANGIVCIQTPEISESQEFTITFTSPHGIEIADNVKTANITVEPLSFKQSWKGQVGVDGEIGISAGIGIEAGIFDADASAASASLAGGISKGLALENSYDKGERKLKISSTIGSDVGEKVSVGLWASGNVMDIAKVKVSPLELSGNTSIVSDQAKSLIIENYDPANPEHISQIAMFLLDANSNNIIAQIVYRIMNVESYNEEEVTQTIKISGGADVGKVKVNIGGNTSAESEFTLFSVGPTSVQTLSSSRNLEDGGFTFSNALSTSIGYDLLQINSLGVDHKIDSDTNIEAGISTEKGFGFWGNFVNNNIKFESEVNSGQFEEFTITSLDEENIDSTFFSIGEKVSAVEKNVIYKGSQSKSLLESDSSLTSLGLGEFGNISVMDLANILNNIAEANVQGQYERDKKYTQKYDASLGLGIKAIAELGLGFNLSGIYSDQFTYESGSVTNNTDQIQSVSTADAEFEASKKTLGEIVAEPMEYIGSVIAENVQAFTGKVIDGVKAFGAAVGGAVDYIVDIMFVEVPQAQTFSVLAVAEETDAFDTSSVATTVGKPYIINIKDNDGNAIADFSDNPLQLTLEYTDADLTTAKINNTPEDLSNLKIYWYNDKTGVFVCVGGKLDYENSSVTADITKSGQYILAFDNCAPSVTNFIVTNNTAKPTFKATVADMSGISDFSFEIDGKEFVNSENISEFYSADTAAFEYQITEELQSGEHTATITASDSAGNTMVNPMTITFNVDAVAPVIDSLDISDKIIAGKINISASVTDDSINSVKAYVQNESGIYTYNLQETDKIWSTEIDIPKDNSINVWITAYDSAGNSTDSDKKIINIRSTTLEVLGKYQNDFTATMEQSSNSVSINAIGDIPDSKLFVAEYDSNNELIKVQVLDGAKTDNSTTFVIDIPQSDNYKIMLWDENLAPVIKAITK